MFLDTFGSTTAVIIVVIFILSQRTEPWNHCSWVALLGSSLEAIQLGILTLDDTKLLSD